MQNTAIAIYKPKIKVWYKSHDGCAKYVVTDAENRKSIENDLVNNRIIKIEDATFGVFQFIEIEEYTGETIETLICNQPRYIRDELEMIRKRRMDAVGKGFDSKEYVARHIERIKEKFEK